MLKAAACISNQFFLSEHPFNKCAIFRKKNLSYRLILTRACTVYQGVRNVHFLENFAYVLNAWSHCVKSVQIRSFLWSIFSCIPTEYGDLQSKSPYSVRIQENMDLKKLRIWTLFTQCPFLCILKTSEKLWFSYTFGWYWKTKLAWNWITKNNLLQTLLYRFPNFFQRFRVTFTLGCCFWISSINVVSIMFV